MSLQRFLTDANVTFSTTAIRLVSAAEEEEAAGWRQLKSSKNIFAQTLESSNGFLEKARRGEHLTLMRALAYNLKRTKRMTQARFTIAFASLPSLSYSRAHRLTLLGRGRNGLPQTRVGGSGSIENLTAGPPALPLFFASPILPVFLLPASYEATFSICKVLSLFCSNML